MILGDLSILAEGGPVKVAPAPSEATKAAAAPKLRRADTRSPMIVQFFGAIRCKRGTARLSNV